MKFSKEDIIKYADKLLMGLSDEEANTILSEFEVIDNNINQINEIDGLEKIEPSTSPFDLYYSTLREDEASLSIPCEELLSNCKDNVDREVRVPKVVGNE